MTKSSPTKASESNKPVQKKKAKKAKDSSNDNLMPDLGDMLK